MAMPLDLVLVRHGESVGNAALADAKAGRSAPPARKQHSSRRWLLTPMGEEQAGRTGEWLRTNELDRFDRYYCSPYVRTMQTAAGLGLADAAWWLEPLLRERDRGYEYVATKEKLAEEFEHSHRSKRQDRFLWRPTGGESIADVDLRMRQVLATLAREMSGQQVICVSHEDAMDALRFRLEKMTIVGWIKLAEGELESIPNCGVLHYTRRNPPDSDHKAEKFAWVRLVDPTGPGGFDWREIKRPRFTNAELEAMVAEDGSQVSGP